MSKKVGCPKYPSGKKIKKRDWVKIHDPYWKEKYEGTVLGCSRGWISVEIDRGHGDSEFKSYHAKDLRLVNRM